MIERTWPARAVPCAIVLVAAVIRLWNLASPPSTIADEGYYATDAENYLGGGVAYTPPPFPTIRDENTWVHPPLGKELIALGVGPLGSRPLGWRLPSAVFGTITVLLVYLLALELWGSVAWAGLAASLVALDGLSVVMSRLAMLDGFLGTFVLAGFLFIARDRRAGPDAAARVPLARVAGSRDLALAGIMFGAAVATKWSGAFALPLAAAMVVLGRRSDRSRRRVGATAFSLVLVPFAVYVAAYLPFWLERGPTIAAWLDLQLHMLTHQLATTSPNPIASRPITWPLLLRPLTAWPSTTGHIADGIPRIVALGNPVLWWGFLLAVPFLVAAIVRHRDAADVLPLGAYLVMWLPWLLFGRTEYAYYMTPAVPFMALSVVAVLRRVPAPRRRPTAVGFAAAAVACGMAFAPVWLGLSVPRAWYEAVLWLPGWR